MGINRIGNINTGNIKTNNVNVNPIYNTGVYQIGNQTVQVADNYTNNIPNVYVPRWMTSQPNVDYLLPPVVVDIGNPIVDIPGCVKMHKDDRRHKNNIPIDKNLVENDSKGAMTVCPDGSYPSYNSTHIHVPCGVFCNSWPTTFSFSLGPTAPIRRDVGPGQSGFSLPALGIVGVSGVSISGSGGGATGGALDS